MSKIIKSVFYIVGSIFLLTFGIGLIFMFYQQGKNILDLITKRVTNKISYNNIRKDLIPCQSILGL